MVLLEGRRREVLFLRKVQTSLLQTKGSQAVGTIPTPHPHLFLSFWVCCPSCLPTLSERVGSSHVLRDPSSHILHGSQRRQQ